MRIDNIGLGGKWLLMLIVATVAAGILYSPSTIQLATYMHQPRSISCDKFSLRIPFLWALGDQPLMGRCSHSIVIVKTAPTILGSKDQGSTLNLIPIGPDHGAEEAQLVEKIFKSNHQGVPVEPFTFNLKFDRCLLAKEDRIKSDMLAMMCSSSTSSVVLEFSGSHHALSEISKMLH